MYSMGIREMGVYMAQNVPVIMEKTEIIGESPLGNIMGDAIYVTNCSEVCWRSSDLSSGSYVETLRKYAESKKEIPRLVFLACDDIRLAKKCAAILTLFRVEYGSEDSGYIMDDADDYDFYDDEMSDDGAGKPDCYGVNMSAGIFPENGPYHSYIPLTLTGDSAPNVVFYNVEGDKDLGIKLQAIDMSNARFIMICIGREHCADSWVLDMRRRYHADVISISEPENIYYERLAEALLSESGAMIGDGITIMQIVKRCRLRFGKEWNEENLYWVIDQALKRAENRKKKDGTEQTVMGMHDFIELGMDGQNAYERLLSMTGLDSVKHTVLEWRAVCMEAVENRALQEMHKNMLFVGKAGTGKTTTARLLAEIMAECGISNGVFCECSRSDLIGKYLGHTAPRVAAKFEAARNGVLFVDEAGFFVKNREDNFLDEAVKEFVRYMELYPDVMVIFALYDSEVENFLALDEGIRSRISEIVTFADYSVDELWQIEERMLEERGYELDARCKKEFCGYMAGRLKKKDFGNAREARKLAEACIRAVSVRHMNERSDNNETDRCITRKDMAEAVRRLKQSSTAAAEQDVNRQIGFVVPPQNSVVGR